MRFKKQYWIGIIIGLLIIILDLIYFRGTKFFTAIIIVAFSIAWLQFWLDFFMERKKEKEVEMMFLNFVRNLVSGIKSGMPVANAIIIASEEDYGFLNAGIKKLANQLKWSIPLHRVLVTFAKGTKNNIIKRAISTVIEAEESGGNIEEVLESITSSLLTIKKIKDRREASVHTQIIQSYIIFLVFLGVMVVIQNFLIPYLTGEELAIGSLGLFGGTAGVAMRISVALDYSNFIGFFSSLASWFVSLNGVFLMLVLIQGFFAGIVIGKLAVGNIRSGLKHSIVLMTLALLVMTIAQG